MNNKTKKQNALYEFLDFTHDIKELVQKYNDNLNDNEESFSVSVFFTEHSSIVKAKLIINNGY